MQNYNYNVIDFSFILYHKQQLKGSDYMSIHKITMIKEDGTKRTKEEYDRLTCKGKKVYFFAIRFTDINGNRKLKKSKQFAKREETVEAEKEFLFKNDYSLSTGNKIGNLLVSDMTLDYLAEKYFESYVKEKGNKKHSLYKIKKRYSGLISPILGQLVVTKINKSVYKNFKEIIDEKSYGKSNRKYKLSYKNTIHGLVVSILNFAMHEYDLTSNIAINVGRFQKDNTWEEEEEREAISKENLWDLDVFNTFISVVDDSVYNTWFTLLYFLGLRRGESLALRWVDAINIIENKELKVYKNLIQNVGGEKYVIDSPKTKASKRTLDVPNIIIEKLEELYKDKKQMYNFSNDWFIFGDEEPIPKTTADRIKDNYMRLAEVQRITFHEMRHSFCSYLLTHSDGKINIYDVKRFLGHSSIETTQRIYTHVLGNDKKKISNFFNEKLIERKNVT